MPTPVNPYQSPQPIGAEANDSAQLTLEPVNESQWFVSDQNESLLAVLDSPWISPRWFAFANQFWLLGVVVATLLMMSTSVLRELVGWLEPHIALIATVGVGLFLAMVLYEGGRRRANLLDRRARLTAAAAITLPAISPLLKPGLTGHDAVVWGHFTTDGLLIHSVHRSVAIPQSGVMAKQWLDDGLHLSLLKSQHTDNRHSVIVPASEFNSLSLFSNRLPLPSQMLEIAPKATINEQELPLLAVQLLADRDQLFGLQEHDPADRTKHYAGTLCFGDQKYGNASSLAFLFLPSVAVVWGLVCLIELYQALVLPLTWQPRSLATQAAIANFHSPVLVFLAGGLFYLIARCRLIPFGTARGVVTQHHWTVLADCTVFVFADDMLGDDHRQTLAQRHCDDGDWRLGSRTDVPVHLVPQRVFGKSLKGLV